MKRGMTILDAMDDPRVFGAHFTGATWDRWRVFLRCLFGLYSGDEGAQDAPETTTDIEQDGSVARQFTGRTDALSAGPFREAFAIVGRRGGKSQIWALIAVYLACFSKLERHLSPGEVGTVMVLAQDRRQARVIFRYCEGLLNGSPALKAMVGRSTTDTIELSNRVTIEIHTASFRSVRGYTILAALLDELAFWRSDDTANPDTEILTALRPGLMTVPGSLLLGASTPYSRSGEMWLAFDKYHGTDGAPVLVWQASTTDMNPTIPQSEIDREYERDAASAAAEYGAQFRSDVEMLIAPRVVDAVTVPGRYELPPSDGVRYSAFTDPSGGSADSFSLAVAHRVDGVAVLDCVREVKPPFSPDAVVREFADVLKAYGCREVQGDRYGGNWPAERFRVHGIEYKPSALTKSEIYLASLPLLNAARVELLDVDRLKGQLCGLERKTSRAGRDSIDHGPRGHDDVANAACGALVAAQVPERKARVGHYTVTSGGGVIFQEYGP